MPQLVTAEDGRKLSYLEVGNPTGPLVIHNHAGPGSRHLASIAPGCYGAFGDNSAAEYLSKIDALGGALALRFVPGFQVMRRYSASRPKSSGHLESAAA